MSTSCSASFARGARAPSSPSFIARLFLVRFDLRQARLISSDVVAGIVLLPLGGFALGAIQLAAQAISLWPPCTKVLRQLPFRRLGRHG